jgi:hypothetical protein
LHAGVRDAVRLERLGERRRALQDRQIVDVKSTCVPVESSDVPLTVVEEISTVPTICPCSTRSRNSE